jgi:hypothetical protein
LTFAHGSWEGRDLSTRVEWGDQELPPKSDLQDEDEAKGEKRKDKSEVATRRPIDVEMMREKQILIKFGEHIILIGGGGRDDC